MKIIIGWYEGLKYPFEEKDWREKMWVIPALGLVFTPFIEWIVLRGWRVELVKRIGLKEDYILPKVSANLVLKYFFHGIKLWLITGLYIVVPFIVFSILGINPLKQLWIEITQLLRELYNYLVGNGSGRSVGEIFWTSFWAIFRELLIENLWLLFYYPYYRTAMIRYAIIGKFRKSHLAIGANIQFIFKNLKDYIMLVVNQIIDKMILFFVMVILNIVLSPFLGLPIATLFLSYADYWTSGYEYGMIAQKMVAQNYPQLLSVDLTDEGEYDQEVEFV